MSAVAFANTPGDQHVCRVRYADGGFAGLRRAVRDASDARAGSLPLLGARGPPASRSSRARVALPREIVGRRRPPRPRPQRPLRTPQKGFRSS